MPEEIDPQRVIYLLELMVQKSNPPVDDKLDRIFQIIGFSSQIWIDIIDNQDENKKARNAALKFLTGKVTNRFNLTNSNFKNHAEEFLKFIVDKPMPKELKALILKDCAKYSRACKSAALALYDNFAHLVPTATDNGSIKKCEIFDYIKEIEPRTQEYSLTIAFVSMLNSIFGKINQPFDAPVETSVRIVTEIVFPNITSRAMATTDDKLTLLVKCINIFLQLIENYNPSRDGISHTCSFKLMSQILEDGNIFHCIMTNLDSEVYLLQYGNRVSASECSFHNSYIATTLLLLDFVMAKQETFMVLAKKIQGHSIETHFRLEDLLIEKWLDLLICIPTTQRTSDRSAFLALKLLTNVFRKLTGELPQKVLHKMSLSFSSVDFQKKFDKSITDCLRSQGQVKKAAEELAAEYTKLKLNLSKQNELSDRRLSRTAPIESCNSCDSCDLPSTSNGIQSSSRKRMRSDNGSSSPPLGIVYVPKRAIKEKRFIYPLESTKVSPPTDEVPFPGCPTPHEDSRKNIMLGIIGHSTQPQCKFLVVWREVKRWDWIAAEVIVKLKPENLALDYITELKDKDPERHLYLTEKCPFLKF